MNSLKHTDDLQTEILALLAASKLSSVEKQLWIEVLPTMTGEEKTALKKNLEQEIEYEIQVAQDATERVCGALEKAI
ncbi:hypothetical protein HYW83_00750 [Candidatus Peregrinibacteria bacterium]|nr:hypothetical protein [Candidatus Peregrinibacteria bacterium]